MKKIVTLNVIKRFCMQAWSIFTNVSPRPETPGPTYNSVRHTKAIENVNVQKQTKTVAGSGVIL